MPEDFVFEVEATQSGFIDSTLKEPGERFWVSNKAFSNIWMKKVLPLPAEKGAPAPVVEPTRRPAGPSVEDLRTLALQGGPKPASASPTAAELAMKSLEGQRPSVPKPPSLDEVLAAGYSQEKAEEIVAAEQAKSDAGLPPYVAVAPVSSSDSLL